MRGAAAWAVSAVGEVERWGAVEGLVRDLVGEVEARCREDEARFLRASLADAHATCTRLLCENAVLAGERERLAQSVSELREGLEEKERQGRRLLARVEEVERGMREQKEGRGASGGGVGGKRGGGAGEVEPKLEPGAVTPLVGQELGNGVEEAVSVGGGPPRHRAKSRDFDAAMEGIDTADSTSIHSAPSTPPRSHHSHSHHSPALPKPTSVVSGLKGAVAMAGRRLSGATRRDSASSNSKDPQPPARRRPRSVEPVVGDESLDDGVPMGLVHENAMLRARVEDLQSKYDTVAEVRKFMNERLEKAHRERDVAREECARAQRRVGELEAALLVQDSNTVVTHVLEAEAKDRVAEANAIAARIAEANEWLLQRCGVLEAALITAKIPPKLLIAPHKHKREERGAGRGDGGGRGDGEHLHASRDYGDHPHPSRQPEAPPNPSLTHHPLSSLPTASPPPPTSTPPPRTPTRRRRRKKARPHTPTTSPPPVTTPTTPSGSRRGLMRFLSRRKVEQEAKVSVGTTTTL